MGLFKKLTSIFKPKKPAKKPVKKPRPTARLAAKRADQPKADKKKEAEKPVKRPPVKKKDLREIYKILKEPHISEKATVLTDQNKYVFKIMPRANKVETKKAVENLYGVRVKDVNIINVHRKRKVLRGVEGFKTGYKKAIVTLKEGEKIEIVPR